VFRTACGSALVTTVTLPGGCAIHDTGTEPVSKSVSEHDDVAFCAIAPLRRLARATMESVGPHLVHMVALLTQKHKTCTILRVTAMNSTAVRAERFTKVV